MSDTDSDEDIFQEMKEDVDKLIKKYGKEKKSNSEIYDLFSRRTISLFNFLKTPLDSGLKF